MANFYDTMKSAQLNHFKAWTISNNRKEPINPQTGLKYHFEPKLYRPDRAYRQTGFWGDLAHDPDRTLVSLDDLFNEPQTPQHAFALRVDVDSQHVMLVDVEHVYDHKINPYLRQLPIIYGERSKHGGYHFIVPIDPELLSQYSALFKRTSIKIADTPAEHSGVEFFFHNHYLTFTENQIHFKNPNRPTNLKPLLDHLVDHAPQAHPDSVHNFIEGKLPQVPNDALIIARHAMSPYDFDQLYKFAKLYNDPNFTGDEKHTMPDHSQSYRDYRIVFKIASSLLYNMHNHYKENPLAIDGDNDWLSNPDQPYNPEILTWAVFEISKRYLKPRPKLSGHMIHNQTYQQYLANSAVTYILSDNDTYKRDVLAHHFDLPDGIEPPAEPLQATDAQPSQNDFEKLVENTKIKSDSKAHQPELDFDDYQNQVLLNRFLIPESTSNPKEG